jgi:hypothetical protein
MSSDVTWPPCVHDTVVMPPTTHVTVIGGKLGLAVAEVALNPTAADDAMTAPANTMARSRIAPRPFMEVRNPARGGAMLRRGPPNINDRLARMSHLGATMARWTTSKSSTGHAPKASNGEDASSDSRRAEKETGAAPAAGRRAPVRLRLGGTPKAR